MIDKIISFFDEDNQFKQVWQLKLIKFDIDLDQQVKQYERYLAISHIVQDSKGNPGMRGHFYVTNLRFVWHGANDRDINLSIGLDTINNVYIKPTATGSQTKFLLIVKTQSPGGNKYQFKFGVYTQKQIDVFKKAIQVYKQALSTRLYRMIDTNLKLHPQSRKFQQLPKQQIFNTYTDGKYYENQRINDCQIILTNVRMIIIQSNIKGINYGIPWIMIESYEKTTHWDHDAFKLNIRGLLSGKEIFIRVSKHFNKFQSEFNSLSKAYTKNPVLGIDISRAISKDGSQMIKESQSPNTSRNKSSEIQQIFETKINIKRNKNSYAAQSSVGNLSETFFNQQLGLMMERLPEGVTRRSLWEILG